MKMMIFLGCDESWNFAHYRPLSHKKNATRDEGSTAPYTVNTVDSVKTIAMVYTVDMVDAVDMVYTVDSIYTVYNIQTALHCVNSSMYAYLYCKERLKRYWNGLKHFWAKCVSGSSGWLDTP